MSELAGEMELIFRSYAFLLGLAVGSFLNVCVTRLPVGGSVVRPRSRCPRCGETLAWYDNLPLVSYLWLRGRCRHCGGSIPVRYPLAELATGGIWLLAAVLFGPTWVALQAAVFLSLLLAIAMVDGRHQVIPDPLSLGGLAAGLALSLFPGGVDPLAAGSGAAVGFGVLWLVSWAGERLVDVPVMGGGDVKMLAMMGAFLGPAGVLLALFLASVAGALVYGPVAIVRRQRALRLPFGVFLAVGGTAAYLAGDALGAWYLGLFAG